MGQWSEPVAVSGAEQINRETHHALRLFALSGVRICPDRYAKDPVWFVSITGHKPHSGAVAIDLADTRSQDDVVAQITQGSLPSRFPRP